MQSISFTQTQVMKKEFFAIAALFILSFTSCTSTQITSSWQAPDKTITIDKLNKVLVVSMLKSETNNRKAEDQMVGYLAGKGVQSYNYLDANFNKKNVEVIRDKIRADGFDGAVTLRLIDVDKEKSYVPGFESSYPVSYRNFSGYYFNTWAYYSTPGYYSTTKTYTVEVNVFSIKEDKIIWTATTETTDPNGVQKMTADIVKTVYKKMKKDGFISKK